MPSENSLPKVSVDGTVLKVATQIEDGDTVYLIILTEQPNKLFKSAQSVSPELAFVKEGDTVHLSYADVGAIPIDISTFDDLELDIISATPEVKVTEEGN